MIIFDFSNKIKGAIRDGETLITPQWFLPTSYPPLGSNFRETLSKSLMTYRRPLSSVTPFIKGDTGVFVRLRVSFEMSLYVKDNVEYFINGYFVSSDKCFVSRDENVSQEINAIF